VQCQAQSVAVFFKQWGVTCPVNELPPSVRWEPGSKLGGTTLVDAKGTAGIEVDRATAEMHLINRNKKALGRHLGGQLYDGYPSLDHFPAKMRAYTEAMV